MTFSNPAGNAPAAAAAYGRALLDLLHSRDPLELMAERRTESVGQLLRLMGAHDRVPRRQIDRILSSTR